MTHCRNSSTRPKESSRPQPISSSSQNLHPLTTGLQLDGHAIAAIATEVRALETALSRLEHSLAVVDEERHQLEAAFATLTSDTPEDLPASETLSSLGDDADTDREE